MSRKDFEAWISNPPYERMCDRGSPGSAWPGQYKNYETQLAWEAWQAATAKQREKDTEICESFIHTYVKDGERWMQRERRRTYPAGIVDRPGCYPGYRSRWRNRRAGVQAMIRQSDHVGR